MGTKNKPGDFDCYAAADDDEPMFVLLARDPIAPALIRQWVILRMAEQQGSIEAIGDNARKCQEALLCATNMDLWRLENPAK